MNPKSLSPEWDKFEKENPLYVTLAYLCGYGGKLAEPPKFTQGARSTDDLTDDQFQELQSWVVNCKLMLGFITGIGVIDAANAIITAAEECGLLPERASVHDGVCQVCHSKPQMPLIYTGFGGKSVGRCPDCLPDNLKDAVPSHWLPTTAQSVTCCTTV